MHSFSNSTSKNSWSNSNLFMLYICHFILEKFPRSIHYFILFYYTLFFFSFELLVKPIQFLGLEFENWSHDENHTTNFGAYNDIEWAIFLASKRINRQLESTASNSSSQLSLFDIHRSDAEDWDYFLSYYILYTLEIFLMI